MQEISHKRLKFHFIVSIIALALLLLEGLGYFYLFNIGFLSGIFAFIAYIVCFVGCVAVIGGFKLSYWRKQKWERVKLPTNIRIVTGVINFINLLFALWVIIFYFPSNPINFLSFVFVYLLFFVAILTDSITEISIDKHYRAQPSTVA